MVEARYRREDGYSLRSRFVGHYAPTKAELDYLWNNATIVFDTNALLNLYRYSPEARSDLLAVMHNLSDRIWIPHQVALEFHNNRLQQINKQQKVLDEVLSTLDKIAKSAEGQLGEFRKNPFCNIAGVQKRVAGNIDKIKSDVKRQHSSASKKYGITKQDDPILHKLASLYDGKVGREFATEELDELYGNAEKRYGKEIPPGYRDSNKEVPGKYGDYIAWEQILQHAESNSTDILLVTDELKDDWWWISQGETIGPRPELRQEFADRTQRIYFQYKPGIFLSEAEDRLNIEISSKAVNEISETSTELARYEQSPRSSRSRYLHKMHNQATIQELVHDKRLRAIDGELMEANSRISEQITTLQALKDQIRSLKYTLHTTSDTDYDARRSIRSQLIALHERSRATKKLINNLEVKREQLALDRESELYRMAIRNRADYSRHDDTHIREPDLFQDFSNTDVLQDDE